MPDNPNTPLSTTGLTVQLYVPSSQVRAARAFYSQLFGRQPDFEPHDDFFEWGPIPGQECWIQVAGRDDAAPCANRIRFRITDMSAAVTALDELGLTHSEPSQLPGVVAFLDFADPWDNQLGYFQDLAPTGQQPEYRGTSVNDETQFTGLN